MKPSAILYAIAAAFALAALSCEISEYREEIKKKDTADGTVTG
jgi:hypothetical protein